MIASGRTTSFPAVPAGASASLGLPLTAQRNDPMAESSVAIVIGKVAESDLDEVVVAEETGNVLVDAGDSRPPRVSRSARSPLVHDADAISNGDGFFLVMGDEQEGGSDLPLQPLEKALHLPPQFGVECTQRFVEQDEPWLADDRPGEGDALLLTAAQLCGIARSEIFQRDEPQGLVRRAAGYPSRRDAADL